MEETSYEDVIFGQGDDRLDVPKLEIYQFGINVILKIDFPEIFKYHVNKDNPLPTGESIGTINKDAYSEDYHGLREF